MYHFADRMDQLKGSILREIIKLMTNPEIISFSGGSPAKESFDIALIETIIQELLEEKGNEILQYGASEGQTALREAYIRHISEPKGVNAEIENVLITTGATQGIYLAADIFLNPGDVVLVESPTFLTTLMVFDKFFAKVIPVETDENGMLVEDLEEKMKLYHPKMMYSIPTFQNPTGRTLPLERRKKIAELASEYNVMVIEDDPYCDLRYFGEALPPIKSFDTTGNVMLFNSFSKTISPGFRVGTALAETEIIRKMTVAKQCADTHTSNLTQMVCAEFLNKGLLPGHLEKIIPIYRERLQTMLNCIDEYFPEGTLRSNPQGGLFIWVKLPGNPNVEDLMQKAIKEYKVAFVPGSPFFVNKEEGKDSIRLNFSACTPDLIQTGMERLGEVFCSK